MTEEFIDFKQFIKDINNIFSEEYLVKNGSVYRKRIHKDYPGEEYVTCMKLESRKDTYNIMLHSSNQKISGAYPPDYKDQLHSYLK